VKQGIEVVHILDEKSVWTPPPPRPSPPAPRPAPRTPHPSRGRWRGPRPRR
jgi:hypothetical protein